MKAIPDTPTGALLPLTTVQGLLGISRRSLTRLIDADTLPVVAIGRRTLVTPDDLAAFVAARRRLGTGGRKRPGIAPKNDDGADGKCSREK